MSDTQVYEVFFRATPEQVWAAITRPEHTERYFFGTRVRLEPRVGGAMAYDVGESTLVDGEVLQWDEGRELATTWRVRYDPTCVGEVSRVRWTIAARGPQLTKLTATHELDGAPNTARNVGTDGWSVVLSGMKTWIETGEPLPAMG